VANPFKYGTVVSGKDFADRQRELKELAAKLKEPVRIFLLAPRRYGKTSLIGNVLNTLQKEDILIADVDLYWSASVNDFLELYASKVIRGSKSISRQAASFVKKFFPRLRPKLSFDPTGNPELSLDIARDGSPESVEEILNLPQRIAESEGKRFAVVFDEFQEIMRLNGGILEKQIRAAIQHHTRVSYLFAGSKTHMLIDMVSDETRPFYQMGTLMALNKIPEKEFSRFVQSKFAQSGKKISQKALNLILAECENIPHYVQLLSFNLWDHFQNVSSITETHVEKSLLITLRSHEPAYLTLWEGLTLHQQKTLRAAAHLHGRLLTAKGSIQQFNLESASNVSKSLGALRSKGILRKETESYVFEDVFLGRWIDKIAQS
jgi:AAA+ ATPase superfamily predicted ATPase